MHGHTSGALCLILVRYSVYFRLKTVVWGKMSRKKMWKRRQETTSSVKDRFIYALSALLITTQAAPPPPVPANQSYTVAILKPDAVAHGKVNEIIMKVGRDLETPASTAFLYTCICLLIFFFFYLRGLDSECRFPDPGPRGTYADCGRSCRFLPAQSSRGVVRGAPSEKGRNKAPLLCLVLKISQLGVLFQPGQFRVDVLVAAQPRPRENHFNWFAVHQPSISVCAQSSK